MRRQAVILSLCTGAIIGVALIIELTGGLPTQLAHLYYLPVVVAALLLPKRYSLAVASLAAVAVSPLPDVAHRALGLDVYYADPSPWNLASSGWIVRPLAFMAICLVGSKLMQEARAKAEAQTESATRRSELTLLSRIDKMILGGSTEEESLREIAALVGQFTGAKYSSVVVPEAEPGLITGTYRVVNRDSIAELTEEHLPLSEGVAGWALVHGKAATSRNVFSDPRYDDMREIARRLGYTAAAAVPIILEGDVLGAIGVAYEEEHDFTHEELATLDRLTDQAAIAIANSRQREALQRLARETAIGLAEAIESRDPYTGDHCSRLANYASTAARAIGLGTREVETIRLGAALHDIGKVIVPDNILKKPAKLTPEEYAVIKQHCYSGGQICKRVSFLEAAFPIVYHHHERYDGRGYPDGIAGERIPLGARIVSVVDAFDAMTSDRPYRSAMDDEEARAILRDGAGSQWDPSIVDTFLSFRLESHSAPARSEVAA